MQLVLCNRLHIRRLSTTVINCALRNRAISGHTGIASLQAAAQQATHLCLTCFTAALLLLLQLCRVGFILLLCCRCCGLYTLTFQRRPISCCCLLLLLLLLLTRLLLSRALR
jgi:hypothetical protein